MTKKKRKAMMIKHYTTLGLAIAVIGAFIVLAIVDEKKDTSSR